MSKVKMNAKHEYEYLGNFKILQTVFKQKKIDKVRDSIRTIPTLYVYQQYIPADTNRKARKVQDAVRHFLEISSSEPTTHIFAFASLGFLTFYCSETSLILSFI